MGKLTTRVVKSPFLFLDNVGKIPYLKDQLKLKTFNGMMEGGYLTKEEALAQGHFEHGQWIQNKGVKGRPLDTIDVHNLTKALQKVGEADKNGKYIGLAKFYEDITVDDLREDTAIVNLVCKKCGNGMQTFFDFTEKEEIMFRHPHVEILLSKKD